jgi:hypothetical protein
MTLSRSIILILVVAGLAAGTALVAGYGDKPSPGPGPQAACQAQCDDCPLQGTDDCCKAQAPGCGACGKACASPRAETTCGRPCASSCLQEAPAAPCAESGCVGCPMGGGPGTE